MKKYVIGFMLGFMVIMVMGAALTVKTIGYENLVVSAAGAESDLTVGSGYAIGVPAPGTVALAPKDLMKQNGESFANSIGLICSASTAADTECTMSLYGISLGGPPERIGSLNWIFGTATSSATQRWADTCVVGDTYGGTIAATDSGNNRVVKVDFGTIGYRYLYGIIHSASASVENITVQMRQY